MSESQNPYAVGGPMSMPLRLEAKKRKTRIGIVGLVLGVPALGLGIYGFARGGAEMLGIWGCGFGLIMITLGVVMLKKASKPYYS